MSEPRKDLKKATSLTVAYLLDFKPREFRVEKPEEVKRLLGLLTVVKEGKGKFAFALAPGRVTFHFADKSKVECKLLAADEIEYPDFGSLSVKKEFYQALAKLATAHAGRKIELLENN